MPDHRPHASNQAPGNEVFPNLFYSDPPSCAQEQIHIPGAIQPHGAMLVTRAGEWSVTHASANLAGILGRPAQGALGKPLRDVIGDAASGALLGIEPSNGIGPTAVQISIAGPQGIALHLRAHRIGQQVCIEIEAARPDPHYSSPLLLTQPVLDSFKHATSGAELCDLAVRGLQAITGYDRVMVYRFDETGDGEVVAEACAPPIQPCLGLRFPASDIPSQARRHYLRQRVGMVPDAAYTPVPMLAQATLDDRSPIDMSYSELRSVSPLHREYMRNMGTAASLTVALVDGEKLWGMLVCHHAKPRISGTELRAAANIIGQVVSLLYGSLRQADLSAQRLRRNTMLRTLVDRLGSSPTLPGALEAVQTELLQLVDATGAVVRLSGATLVFGRTPAPSAAAQIVETLQREAGGEIVAMDNLGGRYPEVAGTINENCGALMLPLSYSSDDAILWLRPEHWQTVHWGGDPAGHDRPDPIRGQIVPRKSFHTWKEIIKHRSLPWTQADVAMAAEVARRVEAEIVRRTKAELAQAQDASRAKSRFLAGMTHELRTPLHGILGYAQLLSAEGGLNDLQAMRVRAMMGASTHLLEMINRVLELSEIEAGQVKLCPAALNVSEMAASCLDVVRPAAEAKHLDLRVAVAPGTLTQIVVDPMRLRQVLLNLVGNAVKFTPHGTVAITMANAAQAGAMRIEVADSGPGIPVGQRTKLFQDFERLEHDNAACVEGAGLGLALSAKLTALMGGCIGFEARPAGGSIFWLELPHRSAALAPPPAARAGPPAEPCGKLRILVVDDVAINRDIAESFLRAAGHKVTSACSGEQAVADAAGQDFDVILMDIRMPGMDGLQATRRIRAMAGRRSDVPIIALTAQAFADQVDECRKAGMQHHLAKPFSPDMLARAVAHAINAAPQDTAIASAIPPAAEVGPIIDLTVFDQTTAYLTAETVANFLHTIQETGTMLLAGLSELSPASHLHIAELAHMLAGSAGMFGFTRASNLGRCFERAAQSAPETLHALAPSLAAAVEATLREIAQRAPPAGPHAAHNLIP